MLGRAAETAAKAGADVRVINLYGKNIRHCTGCMACRSKKKCVIDDDINEIASAITSADSIVIGAPCYWGNMPGILKTMFDRLVYIVIADGKGMMPKPLLKGKKALVIAASTTPMPWARLFGQTSGTVKSITKILKLGGVKVMRSIQIGGTVTKSVSENILSKVDKKISKLIE